MDYTTILHELNKASSFDLHRLRSAIYKELLNPKRIALIKARINVGDFISYFDAQRNGLVDAQILEINKTRCVVRDIKDQKRWTLPFYYLNLDAVDTDIQSPHAVGIPKASLKLGERVGFKTKTNEELFGEVIRLNQKTATIRITEKSTWRVSYTLLFRIIEGEKGDQHALLHAPV